MGVDMQSTSDLVAHFICKSSHTPAIDRAGLLHELVELVRMLMRKIGDGEDRRMEVHVERGGERPVAAQRPAVNMVMRGRSLRGGP